MKFDFYIQKTSNLFAENRLLKFIILVIGITTLYNAYSIRSVASSQKVVLIPPTINSETFISGKDASDTYIKSMTKYIMSLYLNYSPASVKNQIEDLLALYSPGKYSEVLPAYTNFIDDVKQSQVSSVFYISEISIQRNQKRILVEGQRKQYMRDREVTSKAESYAINYAVRDSQFMVEGITSVDLKRIENAENKEE